MPANTEPIFTLAPKVSWGVVDTANTAKDGTGAVVTVFTAGANGSYLQSIRVLARGTNVATVARFWLNNGSTNATAGNNTLIGHVTIATTTNSEVAALTETEYVIDKAIPAGHVVNVTIGTSVAAGLHFNAYGGDY